MFRISMASSFQVNDSESIETRKAQQIREESRNKYRPRHIKLIFVAEAPPLAPDRFFYFEEVDKQDSLFLETMKVLYPRHYACCGNVKAIRKNKHVFLERFRDDGYYLLDAKNTPIQDEAHRSAEICRALPTLLETLCRLDAQDVH